MKVGPTLQVYIDIQISTLQYQDEPHLWFDWRVAAACAALPLQETPMNADCSTVRWVAGW